MAAASKIIFAPLDRLPLPHMGHTKRVARLRVALPIAAMIVLGAVFLWPFAASQHLIQLPPTPKLPQLTMEKPHFTGTDDQNRPYALTATRATFQPQTKLLVDLEGLQAQMTLQDNIEVSGTAQLGRFDQEKKRLWLGGDVDLAHGGGYHFHTDELFIDLGQRVVWGDKPSRVTGAFGTIEGQGFRAYDGGKVVVFTGASRAILNSGESVSDLGSELTRK